MRELLFSITKKDFEISHFSGTGAGGQHRNKHANCVRLRHTASGVIATGQSSKSRQANLREAFKGLINNKSFKIWLKTESSARILDGITLEEKVNRAMRPENIRVEVI